MKSILYTTQKFVFALFLILPMYSFGQLSVSNNLSTAATIQQLFGAGVTISNVSIQGDTTNALGTFDGTMSNLGLDSGIVMATGNITNALPGQSTSTILGYPGDSLLSSVIGIGTQDAFVIEFDIASTCDTIAIQYVFGSNEYPTFVGSGFNDGFAFFITGHAYTTPTNIALVPGTNTPVSINNVNAGVNSNYYVPNTGGTVGYNAFTVPLIAYAQVIPDSTYHIKLVIADALDAAFDSGVFLKRKGVCGNPGIVALNGNTSSNSPIESSSSTIAIDEGESLNITFQHALDVEAAKTIYFQINGSASNGTDFISIPNTLTFQAGTSEVNLPIHIISDCDLEGPETIEIVYTDSSITCSGAIYTDTLAILINDIGGIPDFDLGSEQMICSGESLSQIGVNLSGYAYAWASVNGNGISISDSSAPNPTFQGINNTNTLEVNQIELSVSDTDGCVKKDTISILVGAQPEADFTVDSAACVGDDLVFNDNSAGFVDEWLWDFGQSSGNFSTQQHPIYSYDSAGTYLVRLTVNDSLCSSQDSGLVNIYPSIEYTTTSMWPDSICLGDSLEIGITGMGYTDLTWDIGDNMSHKNENVVISYQDSGVFTISLSLKNQGCEQIIQQNIVAYACEAATGLTFLAPNLIQVYPNPASDKLFLELSSGLTGEVVVSDLRGRIIQKRKVSENQTIIDVESWTDGIYFLSVYTNKGMYREKVLIR